MKDAEVECVVLAASADAEFVTVRFVKGQLQIDDVLTCAETGSRYRILSAGIGGSPQGHAEGIRVLQLVAPDGQPAEGSLAKGMHLVRSHVPDQP